MPLQEATTLPHHNQRPMSRCGDGSSAPLLQDSKGLQAVVSACIIQCIKINYENGRGPELR